MIGGRLCVSCHNREWEFRRGRNAKGTPPRILLTERRIGVILDADASDEHRRIDVVAKVSLDLVEVVAQVLRVAVGKVAFVAPGMANEVVSMREFTKIMVARLPAKPARRRLRGAARGRR